MPFEICAIIHAITIVSFACQKTGESLIYKKRGWPEKVKGLARYVLSRS
jgi:hypothetical protein